MRFILKKKKDNKTVPWSGGSTTELFIFPENSVYKELNFDFRISTSTVDADSSEFTMLPGVARHIMLLDGEMELVHEKQPPVRLSRLGSHQFRGDWQTISRGRCTDFNLMTRGNITGNLTGKAFEENSVIDPSVFSENDHNGIFVISGEVENEAEKLFLHGGDLLLFSGTGYTEKINFKVLKGTEIIFISIKRLMS